MAQTTFMEGIRDLKTASLIFVVGTILMIIAGASAGALLFMGNPGALVGIYALNGIGAIIGIIATVRLDSSARKLDSARPGEYRIAGLLIKLLYIAFLLSMISGFWSAAIAAQFMGAPLSIPQLMQQMGAASAIGTIGMVLTFVGYIGVLIMSIKLKDATGDTMFLVAGILIVIVFLAFIGWILMLVAANGALKKGVAPAPGGVGEVPPPPPPS